MFTKVCTGLLAVLLAASTSSAITVRAKFNPGFWPFVSASIDYWFTVDPSDPIGGPGPDATRVDINLAGFPMDGGSVTTSTTGAGTFPTGQLLTGPPQTLVLIHDSGLKAGHGVHINSGSNPNKVIGFGDVATWSLPLIDGGFIPFTSTTTVPPPAGGTIGPVPAFTALPQVGDTVLTGIAEPNLFIAIFQDNPLLPENGDPLDPGIQLGFAQADPAGNFVIPLLSPLTNENLAVGVSLTDQDVFEGGEIVAFIQPIPEPGSAMVLGFLGAAMMARRRD